MDRGIKTGKRQKTESSHFWKLKKKLILIEYHEIMQFFWENDSNKKGVFFKVSSRTAILARHNLLLTES